MTNNDDMDGTDFSFAARPETGSRISVDVVNGSVASWAAADSLQCIFSLRSPNHDGQCLSALFHLLHRRILCFKYPL